MLIQKICRKGLLHLQEIVSQPFAANHGPHTAIANLNMQNIHIPGAGASNKLEFKISQRGRGRERLETIQFNYIV